MQNKELSKKYNELPANEKIYLNEEAVYKWKWMMDWCKNNGISLANSYFWNLAEKEFNKSSKKVSLNVGD